MHRASIALHFGVCPQLWSVAHLRLSSVLVGCSQLSRVISIYRARWTTLFVLVAIVPDAAIAFRSTLDRTALAESGSDSVTGGHVASTRQSFSSPNCASPGSLCLCTGRGSWAVDFCFCVVGAAVHGSPAFVRVFANPSRTRLSFPSGAPHRISTLPAAKCRALSHVGCGRLAVLHCQDCSSPSNNYSGCRDHERVVHLESLQRHSYGFCLQC